MTNFNTQNDAIFFDTNNMHLFDRYQVSLQRSGLSEEEREIIPQVFSVASAREALNIANSLLRRYDNQTFRCSYNTKFFLEALAIAAEADIAGV